MSLFPPRTKPPLTNHPSGEHASVREFRKKLHSIEDGVLQDAQTLDDQLAEYIATTPPPALPKP